MKLGHFSCCSILMMSLTTCNKPNDKERKLLILDTLTTDSASMELTKKQLVETVLNLPGVFRFSKADYIHEKYGTVSIYFSQDLIADSITPIFQNGNSLELVHSLDTIDVAEKPCYVFSKISVSNNDAYVYMTFDITGAIAYGNLKYIDGQWTPDKEFIVGVR